MSKDYKERGIALILVLWILIILTVTTLGLGYYIRLNLRITKNQTERLKAYYIAKAGIDRAILELRRDENLYDALNEMWSTNEDAYEDIPFGDGVYTIKVIDETGKLYINLPMERIEDEEVFIKLLLLLPKIDEDKAKAILGYRKERDFLSIDELFLLKEIDKEAFLSIRDLVTVYSYKEIDKRTNLNKASILELEDLGLTYKEAEDIIRARPYHSLSDLLELDWMSKDRFIQLIEEVTVKDFTIGRININTAPKEVLEALGFSPSLVEFIIREREESPFESLTQLLEIPLIDIEELGNLKLDLITTKSHTFTIISTATLNDTLVRIKAVVRRYPVLGGQPKVLILSWKELY